MDLREGLCALLPRLRRFARTLARDPADADDLVQVALERALARAAQWRPEQGLDAWVFGIVRNAWIDEVRARRRGGRLFAPEEQGATVGDGSAEAREVAMSVHSAMMGLPEEQREAIALVLVEGLSYKEAAAVLDIPIGTLTSRLARGREALQARLGGTDGVGA
ncbi:sigma-70 family RNA polymerase sigma factor [Arenimonas terrae]